MTGTDVAQRTPIFFSYWPNQMPARSKGSKRSRRKRSPRRRSYTRRRTVPTRLGVCRRYRSGAEESKHIVLSLKKTQTEVVPGSNEYTITITVSAEPPTEEQKKITLRINYDDGKHALQDAISNMSHAPPPPGGEFVHKHLIPRAAWTYKGKDLPNTFTMEFHVNTQDGSLPGTREYVVIQLEPHGEIERMRHVDVRMTNISRIDTDGARWVGPVLEAIWDQIPTALVTNALETTHL